MWSARHLLIGGSRTSVWFVAGFMLLLAGFAETQEIREVAQATTHASPADYLQVEIVDDIVSVEARDVTLKDLLEEIARQSDLELVLQGPLNERLSVKVNRLPLPESLSRLLHDHNFALRYVKLVSGAEKQDNVHPNRLWVFSKESGDDPGNSEDPEHFSSDDNSTIRVLQTEQLNTYAGHRLEAVYGLGTFDGDETIAALSLALADENVHVRIEAVSALSDIGGDQAAAVLAVALGDRNPRVREEMVYALGDIGGETAIQALEQVINDEDNDVRQATIEALADIGGDKSAHVLAAALYDEDASLRAQVVDSLSEIGHETAIHLLRQALTDSDSTIREVAAENLADLSSEK